MNYHVALISKGPNRKSAIRIIIAGFPPQQLDGGEVKYDRLRIDVGSFNASDWDEVLCRPKKSWSKKNGFHLHQEIDEALAAALKAYNETPAPKVVEAVKERYRVIRGIEKKGVVIQKKSSHLLDLIDEWLTQCTNDGTLKVYQLFRYQCAKYEQKTGKTLEMLKWQDQDAIDLHKYLTKNYTLSENTSASKRKAINKFIHVARRNGAAVNPIKGHGFVVPKMDVLEWHELKAIIDYAPKTPQEADMQTMVVAFALGGFRISDWEAFFDGITTTNGTLHSSFQAKKKPHPTCSPVVLEPVRLLLEKNGRPKSRSPYQVRIACHAFIKEVAKTCPSLARKHLVIHSIGRRTFVTLFLGLAIFPEHILASFTGHTMNTGDKGVFYGYQQATMQMVHRSFLTLLQTIPSELTGGIQLLSDKVYAGLGTLPMMYPVREAS